MATKYSKIAIGGIFEAKSGKYRKLDDLYFEDLSTGFQAAWSPVFDETISVAGASDAKSASTNTTDKFIVDPQNRVMKPNPNYGGAKSEAEKVFAELWGTGLFDCGPTDYAYMALQSIKAVSKLDNITCILNSVELGGPVPEDQVIVVLNKWADKMFYVAEEPKPKKSAKKKPAPKKKPVKKGKK